MNNYSFERETYFRNEELTFLKQIVFSKEISNFLSNYITHMYIYIYIHTLLYIFSLFSKMQSFCFQLCSYTQKITLDRIDTFKLSVYKTKHTRNTETQLKNKNIFSKTRHSFESTFSGYFYGQAGNYF